MNTQVSMYNMLALLEVSFLFMAAIVTIWYALSWFIGWFIRRYS